jgi:hypothetical protein
MNQIERIKQMETILDEAAEALEDLSKALERYESLQADMTELSDYYGSAEWRQDLAADEAGELPSDLRRGVLSEDGIYDLLMEDREMTLRLLQAAVAALEGRG